VAVMAAAAWSVDELALDVIDAFAHSLAVANNGPADVRGDLKLGRSLDDDLGCSAPIAADGSSERFGSECTRTEIFIGKLCRADAQLVLIGLRLGSMETEITGSREPNRLEMIRMLLVARVCPGRVYLSLRGGDVAGAHFSISSRLLAGICSRRPIARGDPSAVEHVRAAASHAEYTRRKSQFPDVRVRHDLERQRANGASRPPDARRGHRGAADALDRRDYPPGTAGSRHGRRAALDALF